MRGPLLALSWLVLSVAAVLAQTYEDAPPPLAARLTPEVMAQVFAEATRVEPVADDGPAAMAAFVDDTLVGYVFSTLDVLRAPGYSSTPFDIVSGVTLGGRITGSAVLFHREPYLLNDTRRTALLVQFLDAMEGMEAQVGAEGGEPPQFVAGATISARAMRNAVLDGADLVLQYRTGARVVTEPTVDLLNFRPMSGDELIADGGVARQIVTNADLATAMEQAGLAGLPPEVEPRGGPGDIYLDLRFGYAMPPTIGLNGAGRPALERLRLSFPEGSHALLFASHGAYDFRGTRYTNLSHQFRLERLEVSQGDKVFTFVRDDLINATYGLGPVANLIVLPPDSGFDPLLPWHVTILAFARQTDGALAPFALMRAEYRLPSRYILKPPADTGPAWAEAWRDNWRQQAILAAALLALTLILGFQSALSRSRRAHRLVRLGFLTFTLVWLGWIASAQLSIVHVINYLMAPFQGFGLGFYLAEPLIVMISVYTALSLILLGRGVFCGWLCPFGALQELLANLARWLQLPQWNPKEPLQRKLWLGKYVSAAVVVGLAFVAPAAGAVAEEIEPFKTAITAMFARNLPYVIYALVLLFIGLFTERAYCRFLCPLGGALAVLDRLHLVDLLKRRPECGSPCHLCERSCPVRAIEPSGKIKMAECFQCLDCQVEYHDDTRCPPLALIRKQRQRKQAVAVPSFPLGGLAATRGAPPGKPA